MHSIAIPRIIFFFVLLGLLSAVFGFGRPNVIFILADDLGYGDLSCYGAPDIRTPHLDALALRGVRLTDYYANAAVCTPTRVALMTGRYQQRIGGLEFAIYPGRKYLGLPATEPTLPRLMRDAGYSTALAGKWHLGYDAASSPGAHGFERFFGLLSGNHDYFTHKENNGEPDLYRDTQQVVVKGYTTELITRQALEFIDTFTGERPFFLYIAYTAPHFPYQGPDDGDKPVTNFTQGDRGTYIKMVEALDGAVGSVVSKIEECGLTANTLIVFTSDNGGDVHARNLPLSGRKNTYREGGIRVPCIAVWPGQIPAGQTIAQPVITMDWTATLLGLAGAKPRADRPLDGADVLPVLCGREPAFERTFFWRKRGPDGKFAERAMRSGNWKFLSWPDGRDELFDLRTDLSEKHDLVTEHPSLRQSLRAQLASWERSLEPPLYDQNPDQVTAWPR